VFRVSNHANLTQHELQALTQVYNLADAHTHQSQSPTQRNIIDRLPDLWYEAENSRQCDMEQRFIEAFWSVQRQSYALKTPTLLVYAASIGLAIVGNYLKKKNKSVSLIHPCFDNLYDIFRHQDVQMEPLEESWLHDFDSIYSNLEKNVTADAILIVDPNNPTGFTLSGSGINATRGFEEVVRYAQDHSKLLILDLSFASFLLPDPTIVIFELYELLETSGVSYITIEDTGKTWPVQDAKVALMKCSRDLYSEIFSLHTAYLLNVSPFILNLVTCYLRDSERDNLASVSTLLERNRALAKDSLKDTFLKYQEPKSRVSVSWFEIEQHAGTAQDLQRMLEPRGVYVLPGTHFYWNTPGIGDRFIRLALARNTELFEQSVREIKQVVQGLAGH
jgi:aspartate/methionine/tyrosine aminotransferase